jgi:L-fucose mutarotase
VGFTVCNSLTGSRQFATAFIHPRIIMIKSELIHPELLCSLAKCGHKTQVLIADSNYSVITNAPRQATVIYLNLTPGVIPATLILEKVLTSINVEKAVLMAYPSDFINTIESEYRQILPENCPIEYLPRQDFYNQVKSDQTLLVIASGEQRRFGNLLLTIAPVL